MVVMRGPILPARDAERWTLTLGALALSIVLGVDTCTDSPGPHGRLVHAGAVGTHCSSTDHRTPIMPVMRGPIAPVPRRYGIADDRERSRHRENHCDARTHSSTPRRALPYRLTPVPLGLNTAQPDVDRTVGRTSGPQPYATRTFSGLRFRIQRESFPVGPVLNPQVDPT